MGKKLVRTGGLPTRLCSQAPHFGQRTRWLCQAMAMVNANKPQTIGTTAKRRVSGNHTTKAMIAGRAARQ
jgi:hypothetical protein